MTHASALPLETFSTLPGGELVCAGLEALHALADSEGRTEDTQADSVQFSIEALLVMVGARRLRRAGCSVPHAKNAPAEPELALYEAVARQAPRGAHSRYNALVRRLVSFERAVEALTRQRATPCAAHGNAVG